MGIKNLMKLIEQEAPDSIKNLDPRSLCGRTLAIDASIQLYQYLIQVKISAGSGAFKNLTNEDGKITSHIQGFLTRTLKLMDLGAKPVFVFDGKSPDLKSHELGKRAERRKKAQDQLDELDPGDEAAERLASQTVKVTREQVDDIRNLMDLLGVPALTAESEAEAQCADLVKQGAAYAVVTEDMDTLAFGADMIRRIGDPSPVMIRLSLVLEGLRLTHDAFIDMCILCGCDYCTTIPSVGPKTALKLIREHGCIENVLLNFKKPVPEDFVRDFPLARALFKAPAVAPIGPAATRFRKMNKSGLEQFLVAENGFSAEKVAKFAAKFAEIRERKVQTRLESFFTKQ